MNIYGSDLCLFVCLYRGSCSRLEVTGEDGMNMTKVPSSSSEQDIR